MTDTDRFFPRIIVKRFVSIVLAAFIIIGCSDLEQTDSQVSDLQGFPDVELFGGTISFTKEGLQQFQISAPHISRFDRNNLMLFEDGV